MKEVLKSFTHKSLSEACCDMLDSLLISYSNAVTRQSLSFRSLYRNQLSEALSKVVDNVDATYYIGNIDEETLSGSGESKSIEAVESATSEGKYESMMVFAVDIANGKTLTRSECATLTRGFNRIAAAQPVILFVREGNKLTLSTCERMEYSQEWRRGIGEKLGKVSMLKGIDCSNPHRGHIDILKSLGDKRYPSFDELYKHWMNVFSAQSLTKGFYRDLFEWYQWAVAPESKVSFPGDVSTQDDDREDIDTRVIRLITRLMFVWFIKQKGLVPDSIFDVNYLNSILKDFDPQSATDTNYYQAILQNLFFGTLNRAIIEDGERRDFAKAAKSDVKNLYRYEELFCISEDEVIELFSTVPFLNCGLFECQDKSKTLDGVEKRFYNDGFSRNEQRWKDGTYKYRATVPNVLFFHPEKGIVSIFNRYVFTIEENTPQDVQVALDPELLGKVFENLLGAYNPETKETARNQSGSFYTPREIVQYMVNESLVAHLKRTVDEKLEDKFRQLLDFTTQKVELSDEQKHQIVHALFTCKILDPACGSGAFPMGMLQQMVHVLRQVNPDNNQWREVLLDMASEDSRRAFGIADEEERNKKLDEIRDTFNNALNSPDYTRKLYIIESCIYGVDIQPIAMLITRLRFFITLICEQNEIMRNKPEENFGIKTLPNLESKFVAANSLISADIHKYNNDWTQDSELAIMKDELMAIRRRHFYTRKRSEKIRLLKADEKKREQIHEHINKLVGEPNVKHIAELQNRIKEKQAELSKYQGEQWREETVQIDLFSEPKVIQVDVNKLRRDEINGIIANCRKDIELEQSKSVPKGFEAAVLQVTDWNPYDQNTVSPFLDIEWMFGVRDGFDIVIGNPPYIQLQNDEGKLGDFYSDKGYCTFIRTGDTYCLFYERGYMLLRGSGILCFITKNTWMKASYGERLRGFFSENTNPKLLLVFSGVKVFESATVDTNIMLYSKNSNEGKTISAIVTKSNKNQVKTLSSFIANHHVISQFDSLDKWCILSDIEYEISRIVSQHSEPINSWNIVINRGILTGNNDAFIIDTNQKNNIISNCTNDEEKAETELVIKRILQGKNLKRYSYQWNNRWIIALFPSKKYNIESYPSINKHLLSFAYDELISEGLVDIANNYLEEYCKQKLCQSGKYIIINGKFVLDRQGRKIKSRKQTSNKWFEIQDTINYYKEFNKPKIIWKRIGSLLKFSYDDTGILGLDSTCFATGDHLEVLCCILNSKMGHYLLKDSPRTGTGDLLVSVQAVEPLRVPFLTSEIEDQLKNLLSKQKNHFSEEIDEKINEIIFKLYGITSSEDISFISNYKI